jgi:hypothetical protein
MSNVGPNATTDTPLASISLTEESLGRAAGEVPTHWRTGKPVLCIPGIGPLDEAFTMIAQSIERQEVGVRAEQWDAISMSRVFSLDTEDVELTCLCYLANVTSAQIRYTVRRLRRKAPNAFILVTLAGEATNGDMKTALQSSAHVEVVQQSLRETIAKFLAIATSSSKPTELAAAPSPRCQSRPILEASQDAASPEGVFRPAREGHQQLSVATTGSGADPADPRTPASVHSRSRRREAPWQDQTAIVGPPSNDLIPHRACAAPTVSAMVAPRAPRGFSLPTVVSRAV